MIFKRTIVVITIISILLGNFFLAPPKAKAILGLGDIVSDPIHTLVNVHGWFADNVLKPILDAVLTSLKKRLIESILDNLTQWVQGKNSGPPKFVTNFGQTLSDAFNAGVGGAVQQSQLAPICRTFKAAIAL